MLYGAAGTYVCFMCVCSERRARGVWCFLREFVSHTRLPVCVRAQISDSTRAHVGSKLRRLFVCVSVCVCARVAPLLRCPAAVQGAVGEVEPCCALSACICVTIFPLPPTLLED